MVGYGSGMTDQPESAIAEWIAERSESWELKGAPPFVVMSNPSCGPSWVEQRFRAAGKPPAPAPHPCPDAKALVFDQAEAALRLLYESAPVGCLPLFPTVTPHHSKKPAKL